MDKKLFKSILLLVTYTVLLILFLLQFDALRGLLSHFLFICRPLFIGIAIAFVLHRPCVFFTRLYQKRLEPRPAGALAVASSYFALVLVIMAIFSFVLPQFVLSMELFASNLGGYVVRLQQWVSDLIARFGLDLLRSFDPSSLGNLVRQIIDGALNMATLTVPHIFATIGNIFSVLVTTVLALVFSVYMLSGGPRLIGQLKRVLSAYLPPKICAALFDVAALTTATFTRFVAGQLTEACILGALCTVGMLFIQAGYAPLVGVVVGVSALIPIAGAYIGAFLSAAILLMVSPIKALIFLVFLLVLQQLEGNIIYPRVVGTSLGLPGIWVLGAITVGGGLFGFVGMLLGVPVTSVLYTLLRRDVRSRLSKKGSP